jgi:putative ATPase
LKPVLQEIEKMQQNLFSQSAASQESNSKRPLSERMRPQSLDDFVGQEHLVGKGQILRKAIENDTITSMILWGPPGCGKTTLAKVIAQSTKNVFIQFSAVVSGIKEIKSVMAESEKQMKSYGCGTILFIDEIHRFNKAQQDAFLPHVERGDIVLIGTTTENPSFELNSALLSRCQVFVLNMLTQKQIKVIIKRSLNDKINGLGKEKIKVDETILDLISLFANGDARIALNIVHNAFTLASEKNGTKEIAKEEVSKALQKKSFHYDKSGEEHFNLISALHKSMRNSDHDAALYWLARMLEAGEEPLYIARRLVRFASEDIGLADPHALTQAVNATEAVKLIGMPEGNLALAQAVIYLSTAPKSNAVYSAYIYARSDVENTRREPVPLHLRNAPTDLMKEFGYGKGYEYAHEAEDGISTMSCLPKNLLKHRYFFPSDRGYEKEISERIEQWKIIKSRKADKEKKTEFYQE